MLESLNIFTFPMFFSPQNRLLFLLLFSRNILRFEIVSYYIFSCTYHTISYVQSKAQITTLFIYYLCNPTSFTISKSGDPSELSRGSNLKWIHKTFWEVKMHYCDSDNITDPVLIDTCQIVGWKQRSWKGHLIYLLVWTINHFIYLLVWIINWWLMQDWYRQLTVYK